MMIQSHHHIFFVFILLLQSFHLSLFVSAAALFLRYNVINNNVTFYYLLPWVKL